MVKNQPCSAKDQFDPSSGKVPHAAEQLSPCATTTEPARCSRDAGAPGACALQQGKPPQ